MWQYIASLIDRIIIIAALPSDSFSRWPFRSLKCMSTFLYIFFSLRKKVWWDDNTFSVPIIYPCSFLLLLRCREQLLRQYTSIVNHHGESSSLSQSSLGNKLSLLRLCLKSISFYRQLLFRLRIQLPAAIVWETISLSTHLMWGYWLFWIVCVSFLKKVVSSLINFP